MRERENEREKGRERGEERGRERGREREGLSVCESERGREEREIQKASMCILVCVCAHMRVRHKSKGDRENYRDAEKEGETGTKTEI